MKKLGATPSDRAYIKRRANAGASAEDISDECNVIVEVVKAFMPGKKNGRAGNRGKGSAKKETASREAEATQLEIPLETPEPEAKAETEAPPTEAIKPPSRKRSAQ